MADNWNVGDELQTPQGKSHINSANSSKSQDSFAESSDYANLYKQGLALFQKAGFVFERSSSGSHCGHRVYRRCTPKPSPGITYPRWFKCLRLVESVEDEVILSNAMLRGHDSGHIELQQFWSPLTQPMNGMRASPLQGYVERLIEIDSAHLAQNESEAIDLGIQYGNFTEATAKKYRTPRAYIPPKEWFSEVLQDVTFGDIFTLWPKPELSLLQLVLGRAMAGRSGSRPVGEDRVLEHTYRTVAIIVGEDAGLGKSTVFEKLFKAMNTVGYQRVNFRDISDRFDTGLIAASDIAYKDDLTGKSLKALISSENTKVIASGGMIVDEGKFKKASSIASRTVLLGNTNTWDPREAYNLDPGTVDRIKLIATYRRNDLQRMGQQNCSSSASDSPNFAPFVHIAWLADKLGVSQEALMLWACRLAVDEFTKYTFWRGDVPNEGLRHRIHNLSSRLTFSFNKDSTRAIISCMLFSHVLLSHLQHRQTAKRRFEWREVNQEILTKVFRDFRNLASDEGLYRLRELIRLHWEQNGRPDTHPWSGLRKLNVLSLRSANAAMVECVSRKAPLPELIKGTFEQITLRDGFKGSSDIVWVTSSWQACKGYMEDIEGMARLVNNILDDEADPKQMEVVRERIGDLANSSVRDGWLDSPNYSPTRVSDLLSKQHEGMDVIQYSHQLDSIKWGG